MPSAFYETALFRASPNYKLVAVDRLAEQERRSLEAADDGDDLYGALVPQGGTGALRAASCDTALLFLALAEPGALPRFALRRLGAETHTVITRLLLDGVLQISLDGQFRGGAQVAGLSAPPPHGGPADLGVAALRYGQELCGLSDTELGRRLYFYGRKPLSPRLQARLGDGYACARFLGTHDDGAPARLLRRRYAQVPPPPGGAPHWWQWLSTTEPPCNSDRRAGYKLYLSPQIDDTPAALSILIGVLPQARGVTGFKVGVGLEGLCRPDKIVVYFTELDDLFRFAGRLRRLLAGCAAHGVPFSAAASDDALLSWGADPPRGAIDGARATSWRMWVACRLAEYLVAARAAPAPAREPWQYALERLALAGIDTGTWIPANGMWPTALELA